MYCTACGTQNDDNAYKCVKCGKELVRVAPAAPANIPNYLVQAILITICCCLPFGIAAIVFAAQVNGKAQAGDIAGAMESSRKAKMWCWWGFGIGLVANLIIGAIQFAAIAAGQAR
jgi:uncharacterized membrane protein YvbJ